MSWYVAASVNSIQEDSYFFVYNNRTFTSSELMGYSYADYILVGGGGAGGYGANDNTDYGFGGGGGGSGNLVASFAYSGTKGVFTYSVPQTLNSPASISLIDIASLTIDIGQGLAPGTSPDISNFTYILTNNNVEPINTTSAGLSGIDAGGGGNGYNGGGGNGYNGGGAGGNGNTNFNSASGGTGNGGANGINSTHNNGSGNGGSGSGGGAGAGTGILGISQGYMSAGGGGGAGTCVTIGQTNTGGDGSEGLDGGHGAGNGVTNTGGGGGGGSCYAPNNPLVIYGPANGGSGYAILWLHN